MALGLSILGYLLFHAQRSNNKAEHIINSYKKQFDIKSQNIQHLLNENETLNNHISIIKNVLANIEKEKTDWKKQEEHKIRADALKKSKSILRGQAVEHLAPFLTSHDFNPKDMRFLGDPVDYIIYDGMSDLKAGNRNDIEKIVFMDIKTGQSSLNKTQRRIRDAVKAGKVEFITERIETKKSGDNND